MEYSSSFMTSLLLVVALNVTDGQPLVPALFIFGDSLLDVGNNNYLYTAVKSNFPPYGGDFQNHLPTGRFCSGKLASDFHWYYLPIMHTITHDILVFGLDLCFVPPTAAEKLVFTSYPPAYLNLMSKRKNILNGANFASAASGYYELTAKLYHTIPLSQQLEHYKEYQNNLAEVAGRSNASSIISGAIYLLNAGNSDFIQNYYINPLLYKNLYALGARRIGVTTVPPMGCLPAAITIFGFGSNDCVVRLNNDAINFNRKLHATSQNLKKLLPGLSLVYLDIYQPLYALVTKPSENGFSEASKACCGTGLVETSFLCNNKSIGTCANASEYIFWDGFHPSETANKVFADDLLAAGISLIS